MKRLLLLLPFCLFFLACQKSEYNVAQKQLASNVTASILPEIELLSGVLSQTSWMKERGPQGEGHPYFRALKSFFDPYKTHKAMLLAEELTQRGFTYDAPPSFILELTPLPDLNRPSQYSSYTVNRAGDEKILEEFRLALKQLAEESRFQDFYNRHRNDYLLWINYHSQGLKASELTNWFNQFYGWNAEVYSYVFAPAMFPQGGYGPKIIKNGALYAYDIVRCRDTSQGPPEMTTGYGLLDFALHEFGHSFVNPALEKHRTLAEEYGLLRLFTPVEEKMKQNAYPTLQVFLNETVVRATAAKAFLEITHDQNYFNAIVKDHETKGFHLVPLTLKLLDEYTANRATYKRFDDFVPYLYAQYRDAPVTIQP